MKSFIKRGWIPTPTHTPVERPTTDTSHRLLTTNQNTMFKIFKFNWENAFLSLLWLFTLCAISILMVFIFSKKYTFRYTLGGTSSGSLEINKEIDWSADETIVLDRSITYSEAIRMVDSLNNTLK